MRRVGWIAAALMGLVSASAPASADDAFAVTVSEVGQGAYRVVGAFSVAADPAIAWRVLTDYDRLGAFIPSMKSRLIKREGAQTAMVSQATTTRFLAVSATTTVLLRLREAPPGLIAFVDVSGRDFSRYEGAWRLTPIKGGTRVGYEATAHPRFVPPLIGRSIMQGTVTSLLQDLRQEILRQEIVRRRAG